MTELETLQKWLDESRKGVLPPTPMCYINDCCHADDDYCDVQYSS